MGWTVMLGLTTALAGNAEILQKTLEDAEQVYLEAREMQSAITARIDREPEVLDGVLDQLVAVVDRVASLEKRWGVLEKRAGGDDTVDLAAFEEKVTTNLGNSREIAASVSQRVMGVRMDEARALVSAGSSRKVEPLARAHVRLGETLDLLAATEDLLPTSPRDEIFQLALEATSVAGAWDPAAQWAADCLELCTTSAARVEAHVVQAQVARTRDRDKGAATTSCQAAHRLDAKNKDVQRRCDDLLGRSWRK